MLMTKAPWLPVVCCLILTAPCVSLAAWPPSKCTHVEVLDSGDTDQVSFEWDGGVLAGDARLEDAAQIQLDTLGDALYELPEILCQALRKVAFVYRPPDDEDDPVVSGWSPRNDRQNLVYLNTHSLSPWNKDNLKYSESARLEAIHRVIHESTHAAIRLLQSQQDAEPYRTFQERADADLWPASAQQMAKDIIAANRLETGVIREWQRMHDAFVAVGMADAYYGSDWVEKDELSSEALAKAGFMSAYGGEQAIEDIAEMTSWAIVRRINPYGEDHACKVMTSRSSSSIDSADAAVYTKLGFVHTLNFISETFYNSCVGNLRIDTPGPGFHSYKSGNLDRSYTGNPRAGVGRGNGEDEEWLLADITADGEVSTSSGSVPVTVQLVLNVTPPVDAITDPGKTSERLAIPPEEVSYPRGVYLVGFRHNKHNRLFFRRRSDGAMIVDVGQGVALVGRAGSDGIVGSVFVQRIFNYSGGLLSAIAGDEPVSEESRVTFRYEPQGD